MKIKRFFIRGIEILAIAILCIPLFVSSQTLYPYLFPKIIAFQTVVEVALIMWLLLVACDRTYFAVCKRPLTLALLLFLFVATVTSLFGVDPIRSFFSTHERMTGVILFIHLVIWYVIMASVFREKRQWNLVLWATLAVSLFMGILSIDSTSIIDLLLNGKKWQPLSPLGNPIYLGVYALIHVFLALFLYIGSDKKPIKHLAIACAGWNIFILFISASRGPLIAFLIGIALFITGQLIILRSAVFRKRLFIGIAIGITTIVIVITGIKTLHVQLPYTIEKFTTQGSSGMAYRLKLWGFGIDAFRERPFTGWGWENFYYYYNQHYKQPGYGDFFTDTWVDKTHNQLIDILTGTGAVGFTAYMVLWIVLFTSLFRIIMRDSVPMAMRSCSLAIASALCAYFIQNLSIFDSPASLILFSVLLALSYFLTTYTTDSVSRTTVTARNNSGSFGIVLAALLVVPTLCIYFVYTLNIAPFQESTRVASGLMFLRQQPEKALIVFKEAFAHPSYISVEGRLQLAGEIVNALLPMNVVPELKKSIVTFALDELTKSIREHPRDVKNLYAYAMLSRINYTLGDTDLTKAKEYIKKAYTIAPYRSETIRESYELYSMTGDVKEATKWAELYGKNFNSAESHYLLGMMYLRSNDFAHALGEFSRGDREGYNAFQNQSIFRFIGYNISAKDITKEYLAFVDRGVEYYPNDPDLLTARIIMHYKAGDREAAKKYMSELKSRNAPLATEIEGYLESIK